MDTGNIIDANLPAYAVDIHALVIAFIIGVAIPWVTEFITHATAPMWVRSFINFALSALTGVLTTIMIADFSSFSDYLLAIAMAWLATMRAHYAGMANMIAVKTAEVGIAARTTPDRRTFSSSSDD